MEEKARVKIDNQLNTAGWIIVDLDENRSFIPLHYSSAVDL